MPHPPAGYLTALERRHTSILSPILPADFSITNAFFGKLQVKHRAKIVRRGARSLQGVLQVSSSTYIWLYPKQQHDHGSTRRFLRSNLPSILDKVAQLHLPSMVVSNFLLTERKSCASTVGGCAP
eukprot:2395673-Amphidinium_carterae.1